MHAESLIAHFNLSSFVLKKNLEGLSHEDSLCQPVPGGNCLNWVVGHIVRTRNQTMTMLGREPIFAADKFDAYEKTPITEPGNAVPFDELLENYDMLQKPLVEGIAALKPEDMAARASFSPTGNPDETVGSLLTGLAFHEAYHAGQTGLLRRVAGKPGALSAP